MGLDNVMSPRRKILITGASGMLGSVLTKRLSLEDEIIGLSKSGRKGFAAGDLSDEAAIASIFESKKPDLVINTAAYSDVDGCERDPKLAHEANALAVRHLSKLCGRFGAPLIHVSTDYVFDGRKKKPYVETDPTSPVNIYGLTKLEGEYYAAHCQSPWAIVRTSWLFGPDNPANFVNAILARMKTQGEVSVLGDQVDAPTSVEDLTLAIKKIASSLLAAKKSKIKCETYHVCNGGSTTRYEMTLKIKEILKMSQVRVSKTDPGSIQGRLAIRPPYAVMSNRHFEKTFRVRLRPWQESLKDYLLN